jgi:hypothetical protein
LGDWKHYSETIRRYKLTATCSLVLIVLSAYAGLLMVEQGYYYWSPFFRAQSSSAIFFSLVFVGVAVQLARRRVSDLDTFSIALATTLSAIWLYELIYHYSFIGYFNYFRYPFFQFSDANTLLVDGALSLLVVVGHKYIRLKGNYLFSLFMLIFGILYVTWLLMGFPQYVDHTFQLPQLVEVANPFATAFYLNRLSKLSLCISWVFLYSRRD